ncbi:BQ5605_C001g00276 [Microbotryum silenes-dioicae]|uniref:BQ5605_C001g00276 protein n=1 Tax=Microbotryum silenes-dioicae TaxID=796604 RepID=A0A2X0P5R1_9BASI|nr:BQ5605_C001g00276 [Microbotryum silenes-dioicae]
MSAATAPVEQSAAGAAHETSIQRVSGYPVVKDSLAQAHALVTSNTYSDALYQRASGLSQQILEQLKPLQDRLPLQTVDSYANATLDFVEQRFPLVKSETGELFKTARRPADDAAGLAKSYADGIQSRLSPVTHEFSTRIAQGQDTLHALQEKLSSTIASLPRDKQFATDAVNSIFKEIESLSSYVKTNVSELVSPGHRGAYTRQRISLINLLGSRSSSQPAHAQARAQPLIDEVAKATSHIREELNKPDTNLSTKASNILSYTQSQVSPLLNSLKEIVIKKKEQAVEVAEESAEATTDKADEVSSTVSQKADKVSSKTSKKAGDASSKVSKKTDEAAAKVNGSQ